MSLPGKNPNIFQVGNIEQSSIPLSQVRLERERERERKREKERERGRERAGLSVIARLLSAATTIHQTSFSELSELHFNLQSFFAAT